MKVIAIAAIAAAAGLATASPLMSTGLTEYTVDNAGVPTGSMVIDVSGFSSWDEQGNAINESLAVFVGVGAEITGLSWDVNITSAGASWASELTMGFESQINLRPGAGTDAPTTNMNFNSGGIIDLSDNGLPNITLSADGVLDIEFFDGFVDNAGAIDNSFDADSFVTIYFNNVPTPGSLAVLGLGGLVAGRRRR